MTAPAITSAPLVQEGNSSIDDTLSEITQAAIQHTIAESGPSDEAETPVAERDEKGRFLAKDKAPTADDAAQDAIADALAVPADVPDAERPPVEPVVLPEGLVAVPKIDRALATQFTVSDAEGALEVPDLMIEFNANGKTRKESLDKVVKLAQFGVYNEERQQQIEATRQESQRVAQQNQQMLTYVKQLEADRIALLSDDTAYLTARAQHDAQQTPEAQMQRLRQENQEQQSRMQFEQAAQTGQQFFASELSPAVEQISQALPTVSPEEIGASLLLVADRFKVHTPFGSIIPPSAYQALRQAMLTDVVPWAQQLHDHREAAEKAKQATTTTEKQALKKAAETAQVDAQKAKNLVGKVGKPAQGRATPGAPPPRVIKTVDDAEASALEETLASVGIRRAS